MEAKIEMGQVGYVTQKLTELEVSEESNEVVGDGSFAAQFKTSETCYAELTDGISTSTDDCVGKSKEEPFIYSGNGKNLVLDDIDNENEVSKDCIPGESEKRLGVSTLHTDCKKGQEMAEVEENIDPNTILSSRNVNEIILKPNRLEMSVNLPEDKFEERIEVNFNLTSSAENKKCVKLSSTEYEQIGNVVSGLIFTPPERENAHNLAKIWTPPEYKEVREVAKKLLSPEFSKNEKEEHFIYSEQLDRSEIQIESRKDEEMAVKIALSNSEKEKDVDRKLISFEGAHKHEMNMKPNQIKLFIDIPDNKLEDEKEINYNGIASKSEKEYSKVMNFYNKFEKKSNIHSLEVRESENDLSSTPTERENAHNMAMIWTPTEYKDEIEIDKDVLSPMSEENAKKEHFIYSSYGMDFVLAENKNEISNDCFTRQCGNRFSLSPPKCMSEQEMAPDTTSLKYDTEKGIGEMSLIYTSVNDQELTVKFNPHDSTKNIPEDKDEVQNQIDLNLNSAEPEKCMNLLPSESEQISFTESSAPSFTPTERNNTHGLAIISASSELKARRDTDKDKASSESIKELQIVNSLPIELKIINGDSSPECNKNIGTTNFVCSECKCVRDSSSDLTCSKVEANKETSRNVALPECVDDGERYVANEKANALETKVIFLKNPLSGDLKNKQDKGKDSTSTDCESRKIPSVSLGYGRYAKDNKTERNVREKYSKETSKYKSEFKFGRTNSTTSHTSNEEDFQVPSDSLAEKIVRQAEFYFSDFNILKNNFLLKHIRRNKEGFLSLKLVSSFRKIKALTKDWRVVAYSLEGSKLLELNAEKSKVRRIVKIPRLRDTSYGKTVVVFNLPIKNLTAEDIKELFSKFGTVVSAEILNLRSPSYNIYHKRCRYFNQEIASNEFGVVEFEKYEDALAAIKDEESHLPKENEMKVVPLMPPKFRSDATRGSSSTSFANSGRGQGRFFKPRYVKQTGRQVDEAKPPDGRPPFAEKYYRGNYRPRNGWKPQSYTDVRGKFPSERVIGKVDDVDKSHQVRRQLKTSNTLNVNPLHQQQRVGPGRFYPGSRFYGARADY